MELVIYLNDEKDLKVLEPLLKRMRLRFEKKSDQLSIPKPNSKHTSKKSLETARTLLLKMHEQGVNASYYGDPLEWQKSTRTDIKLPFRD